MTPIIIFSVGGCLAMILLIVGIVISLRRDRSVLDERLEEIVRDETPPDQYQVGESRVRLSAALTEWLNNLLKGSNWGEKVSRDLAMADLKIKPGEYAIIMLLVAFVAGFIIWFISGKSIVFGIIGGVGGLFLPGIYVKRQQNQRLTRFNNQLGDMLSLMVNGLRAGYSTVQAMEAVSKELPSPISDEFRRVVQEIQLGLSMDQALANLLRRIPSDDLDLTITAMKIQREVGGNLAEILDTISFTIRERVRIKGEIKTLTTQTLYSGRFLAIMPIIVIAALFMLNRPYMMQFFSYENNFAPTAIGGGILPCGYCALTLAGILIVSGYFAMTRLADVEV